MDTSTSAAESRAKSQAAQVLEERFGGAVLCYLLPLSNEPSPEWASWDELEASKGQAENFVDAQRESAARHMEQYVKLDDKLDALVVAEALIGASFQVKATDFDLPEATMAEILKSRDRMKVAMAGRRAEIRKFHDAARIVLHAGLARKMAEGPSARIESLSNVLSVVTRASAPLHQAWAQARAMNVLGVNMGAHANPLIVRNTMDQISRRIQTLVAPVKQQLQEVAYPYEHAQGNSSLLTFVFPSGEDGDDELERAFLGSQALLAHLTPLYTRVLAELWQIAA